MSLFRALLFAAMVFATATIAACAGANGPAFAPATPQADRGLIYVYRVPNTMLGAGAHIYLIANGIRIATMSNGGFSPYEARPGNVTFSIKDKVRALDAIGGSWIIKSLAPAREMITVPVEPAKVYYVRFKLTAKGAVMELVDQNTGESEIRNLGLKMFEPYK